MENTETAPTAASQRPGWPSSSPPETHGTLVTVAVAVTVDHAIGKRAAFLSFFFVCLSYLSTFECFNSCDFFSKEFFSFILRFGTTFCILFLKDSPAHFGFRPSNPEMSPPHEKLEPQGPRGWGGTGEDPRRQQPCEVGSWPPRDPMKRFKSKKDFKKEFWPLL